jgi:CDP-diacylglycerol--serine O-phosphatidyltransferase
MGKIKLFTIPNSISYWALLLSWISILVLIKGNFYTSLGIALLAFVADFLDGYVARRLNQESNLGRQIDGFVDIFIYLIFPALVFYLHFGLQDLISIIVIYVFILAGVFRLARFNIIGYVKTSAFKGYQGLPVVFSYLVILLLCLFSPHLTNSIFIVFSWFLILLQGILMLRTFVFPKPKQIWLFIVILILTSLCMFYLGLST